MLARWKQYIPETAIALILLFFAYRELGSFPRSWIDEGLFIMTAKNVAAGKGYGIPLLTHIWYYPYFLAIGPTVILPSALSIKLFGISVAAARFPMTLYILGITLLTYIFTRRIADVTAARWSTALLVTLSAFINTGKPVLGEVPGYFFLLLGLVTLDSALGGKRSGLPAVARSAEAGIFFGLSVMTKLTSGLILPALAVAWIIAVCRKKWSDVTALMLSGATAMIVYLPWRWLEIVHTPAGSLSEEIGKFVFGGGDLPVLNVLRNNPEILVRMPFLAFFVMLGTGLIGIWLARTHTALSVKIIVTTTVLLFFLYFLNSYGWYRHLLVAHLLLLPFVPVGMERIFRRNVATVVLSAIVVAQVVWQFTHQGSGRDVALARAVEIVRSEYAETDMLIEEAEVFAQLPSNPHWLFLAREGVSLTMPEIFTTLSAEQRCFTRLRKLNEEETEVLKNRAIPAGGYAIITPEPGCR